jgi:hypothetical protein
MGFQRARRAQITVVAAEQKRFATLLSGFLKILQAAFAVSTGKKRQSRAASVSGARRAQVSAW